MLSKNIQWSMLFATSIFPLNIKLSFLTKKITYLLFICFLIFSATAVAQRDLIRGAGGRLSRLGGGGGGGGKDSLQRRDKFADSITVRFRYLDSTRMYMLDSSINDFTRRYPIPATNIFLGNTGLASRSILFSPTMQAGWDPGLHAFDLYKWKLERARFFTTTRPYSEINYMLGSRAEQFIELVHTQNIKPNWNFLLQYRLINSPGFFKNQKTNHNNYQFTSWYQTINKRYTAYLIVLSNKIQAAENGGIQDTANFIDNPDYKERYNIPTKIGGDPPFGTDFFNTDVGTGNRYKDFNVLLRQQYDFGKKDSLVTDSSVIPLFYPRLRFEYTVQYSKSTYNFTDFVADSTFYDSLYSYTLPKPMDTLQVQDQWREIVNDFSFYTFPDAKNLQQFLKLGAAVQNIALSNRKGDNKFYNIIGHGEYRNRSRNQKWDIQANGKFYFTGENAGDYQAFGRLQRSIGKKLGYIQLGFENVNRTPSYIYNPRSEFYLSATAVDFKKENTTHMSATIYQPWLQLQLSGHYYLATNYTYFTEYYKPQQESTLFNMLQIGMQKTIKLGRSWRWHADVYFQQIVGDAPVNVPLIFTRNRIGYEGKLGFKNLNIAFGTEIRYHTPYKADGYSPLMGQFFYQDSVTIDNKMPDIALYLNFRIQSFKFFIRGENLNTARVNDGFGFTNNNFAAPGYPYAGLILRLGIFWSFVN